MMQRFVQLLSITFLSLFLLACAKPTVQDIEPHIRSHFSFALEQGIFEIKNMQFIDGNSAADNSYIAKIEFDVEFLKNMRDVANYAKKHPAKSVEEFHRNEELFNLMSTFGKPKAKTVIHVKADVVMYQKEKFWDATQISIFPQ